MSELYQRWEELCEAGECHEDFESWYSGLVDVACSIYGDD